MSVQDQWRAAAECAAAEVRSGMVVGLGVGRAAEEGVRALARRIAARELTDIHAVPCSRRIADLAAELEIPLTTLDAHPIVDLTIDGADEVDPQLNLIKGAGGALLHEKIVAQASRREIIVVDDGKLSAALGERFAVPVEVIPFAMGAVSHYLRSMGGSATPRRDKAGNLFCTEEGNHIIDWRLDPMPHPEQIAALLDGKSGIVEHGLFLGLATEVCVGYPDRVEVLRRPVATPPPPPRLALFSSPDVLAEAAAAEVGRIARAAVAARGRFLLVLSGGSTPRRLYEWLAGPAGKDLPWAATHVFWGDERCVPPDHPASNYGMARAALLDHVPIPAAQVHRIPAEPDPVAGARAYDATLRQVWGEDSPPQFDLVLLGMGADGHTASLFPGGPELGETAALAVAVTASDSYDPRWRITLTLPVLNAARAVLFLVTGADKQPALRAVLAGTRADQYPAARVSSAGELTWFVDAAAAG